MNETYRWRGGVEHCLRFGQGSRRTLVVLPALFEEANRMRRLTVSIMRLLAERDVETILPDLPGTGESQNALCDTTLSDWTAAVAAVSADASGSVAIRGGALLDGRFAHRWRLAPESGERLLRDLTRATAFSTGRSATEIDAQAREGPTRLAGSLIGPELYRELYAAVPLEAAHVSTVDCKKLWRAAEPGDDPVSAEHIADDILAWTVTCDL